MVDGLLPPGDEAGNASHSDASVGRSETALKEDLERRLSALGDRVEWRKEVWLLCWTHSLREQADRLRVDYVIQIDGDARLLGIEVKAAPDKAADFGRAMLQCVQYSFGAVAPATEDRIPRKWIGRPLSAVFLRTDTKALRAYVGDHARASHRLFGPANVGHLFVVSRGLEMRLCGERFWTEWSGFHQGLLNKSARRGNGSWHPEN